MRSSASIPAILSESQNTPNQ